MKYVGEQTGDVRYPNSPSRKVLVAGWFSFEWGRATAGDLLAGDLACEWLESAGVSYDVAVAPPFRGGVDWRSTNPRDYSHLVFVCGPFGKGTLEAKILNHFAGCQLIGLDLSMKEHLYVWNPFDVLLERDSSAGTSPDIVFATHQHQVPVVGVVLVEPYEGGMTQAANAAIGRLLDAHEVSVVPIDTRLDVDYIEAKDRQGNNTGLRSPSEIESLIGRMDMVITTRLHGMVLALKNGVPAIAIDPEAGGAKITRQADEIGWPAAFSVDSATDEALQEAFDYCLSEKARAKAKECHRLATDRIQEVRDAFISVFVGTDRESLQASPRPPRSWLGKQWHGTEFHSFAETLQADDAQRQRRRRRFQRLSRKNQRIARRAVKRKRQLQNTKRSRPRRILKRIGKLRARVLRK
jgi:Polysaccharide pyruvyl transferase